MIQRRLKCLFAYAAGAGWKNYASNINAAHLKVEVNINEIWGNKG